VDLVTGVLAPRLPIFWPLHPRTRARLESAGLWTRVAAHDRIFAAAPLGYHAMIRSVRGARLALTDSGGLQEECCVLGVPCLTLRDSTERPVTLRANGGLSVLVGNDPDRILREWAWAESADHAPVRPPLWDGRAAGRIVDVFREIAATC
jgi:UDP-N-acetylglucosamine 2-epimerase (non-hydrolysing)